MATKNKEKTPVEYWREVMGGKYLTGAWLQRNLKYVLMLIVMVLIYISNRYYCQQAMLEGKQLTDTLMDRRYKALTVRSQLLEQTLRSNVEENLADSTIRVAVVPSFVVEDN